MFDSVRMKPTSLAVRICARSIGSSVYDAMLSNSVAAASGDIAVGTSLEGRRTVDIRARALARIRSVKSRRNSCMVSRMSRAAGRPADIDNVRSPASGSI